MDSGQIKPRRAAFGAAPGFQPELPPRAAPGCGCKQSCAMPRVHGANRMSDRRIPRAT